MKFVFPTKVQKNPLITSGQSEYIPMLEKSVQICGNATIRRALAARASVLESRLGSVCLCDLPDMWVNPSEPQLCQL